MNDLSKLLEKLKINGLKNTKHRVEILEILNNSDTPISAEDLYSKLKSNNIAISLSTIYRIIDKLVKKGLVNRIVFENETMALFEIHRDTHHHFFICLGCNKKVIIEDCPFQGDEYTIKNHEDFVVIGHKLELYGYCKNCQKKLN